MEGETLEKYLERWLSDLGYEVMRAGKVAQYYVDPKTGEKEVRTKKHDFFGCIDLIAVKSREEWWIQCTSKAGIAPRKKKIELKKERWNVSNRLSIITHQKVGRQDQWVVVDFVYNAIIKDWQWIKAAPIDVDMSRLNAPAFSLKEGFAW